MAEVAPRNLSLRAEIGSRHALIGGLKRVVSESRLEPVSPVANMFKAVNAYARPIPLTG